MGAVDTASSRPIRLSMSKGIIKCWDPDTGLTTDHKGWEGWYLDHQYESNADHLDERFRQPELQLKIHDGEREAILTIRMLSTAFRQFVGAIENVNLRQPFVIRPWYKEAKGDKKAVGGINLFQGGQQVGARHGSDDLKAMVKDVQNPATMQVTKDNTEQMMFLRDILDNKVRPQLIEIAQLQAWEEAPKQIGPVVPGSRLELPPATIDASGIKLAGGEQQPAHIASPDDSEVPF